MNNEKMNFKISTGLKNIIGRELITSEVVAVFELVKNSFDANSKNVDIELDLKNQKIVITDDGIGMSKNDIENKWLFVAYSEKKDINEKNGRKYVGAKGIGRFACDRLGANIKIVTKTIKEKNFNVLDIKWGAFEKNNLEEFKNIPVSYSNITNFNGIEKSGTSIIINDLRDKWDYDRIVKLKKSLEKLVNPFDSNIDMKIELNIVSDDEKQTSMKYEKWYDRNREYLIDDDKYDVYKSLGYALKYSTSRGEFVSKLNKNGMNAEFDDETNITVFESRQGIEYGNYEMYQGEKYSPNELEKVFVKNRTEKDFYSSYWDCVKKSKSMKDFQEMMRDKGYGYSYENDKYIFFSCDNSTVINSQRIDDKVLQCFENKMNIYLSRMKWQSQTIDDFIEKLNKSGCSINTIAGKTVFKMGGYFFVNDDFQINSIKKDLNRRSDIKELMKSVGHSKMHALSKASFIHQLEEQGYKVEWNNDNILFILPNGKSYLNTELNPKADWFNVQTIEKQIHINLDRYIKNLMRQVHSTMDFVELLKSEQSNITGVTSSETMTKHDIEEILKDVGLDFRSLNEYYDLKDDKTELRNAIWQCSRCSLSKDDFISKMEQLGYKVEWEKIVEYDTVDNENTNVSVGSTTFSTDEDLKYDSKIVFTTPFGNKFNNKDFKRSDLYSSDALLKKFQNNNVMNDFDILISFLRLFNSNDRTPVSSAMSLVGSDLNGEKLKEFMYHFEQGTASIYNKNLNNDLSM